jgi:hypothetical protein
MSLFGYGFGFISNASSGGASIPVTGGLVIHLDPSDPSTVFTDAFGINQLDNKVSSSLTNVTQSTDSAKPALASGFINGLDAIQYSQSPDTYLFSLGTSPIGDGPNTAFAILQRTGDGHAAVGLWDASTQDSFNMSLNSSYAIYTARDLSSPGVGGQNAGVAAGGAGPSIITGFQASTTNRGVRRNGVEDSGGFGANNFSNPVNLVNVYLGRMPVIPSFEGYVGEVLWYNRLLASQEILDVENYLSLKWGIALVP